MDGKKQEKEGLIAGDYRQRRPCEDGVASHADADSVVQGLTASGESVVRPTGNTSQLFRAL